MKSGMDYLLGQLLSLIFYGMTLLIYNRARKEYAGGKIADAINLVMIFLAILFLADSVDYFLAALLSVEPDTTLIIKILLKLIALSVLFFGGLRFFSKKPIPVQADHDTALMEGIEAVLPAPVDVDTRPVDLTVTLDAVSSKPQPTLGRYEIIEQIGRGAMGIVYKGRDPKLQRLTAIKTIRFIDDFDEDKVEKVKAHFYREAEVVARLSHRNIVTIYDVGEDLDLSYLAMEYLEGESLEKSCEKENLLSIPACVDIIIQVCDALDYAHANGIIHRDIKPGNIMLLKNGEIKVTDFGIARAVGSTKTRTGTIKGTPYYMSPEQAKGMELTGASDLFSLGVVFYQLLTGRLPFSGENLTTVMYQTANVDPESPDQYNPEIGQPILEILNRALKKEAGERYQTAGQMAIDLRRLQKEWGTDISGAAVAGVSSSLDKSDAGKEFLESNQAEISEMDGSADRLDFSDLDPVLTMKTENKIRDRYVKTVSFEPDEKLDRTKTESGETNEIDMLDPSDSSVTIPAGRASSDETDRSIPYGQPTETRSYKVIRTISAMPPGREVVAVAQTIAPDDSSGGSRIKSIFANRITILALACLVLLGAFGVGYFLLWKSPESENRFFKKTYYRFFQSAEEKQAKMLEEQRRLVKKIMQEKLLEKQRQVSAENEQKKVLEEQKKGDDEQRKEQLRIVKQKLEEARQQKETERIAKKEAQKREEQARQEKIRTEKKKEQGRLAAIEAKKRAEEKRISENQRKKTESLRQSEIETIENHVRSAAALRQNENYKAAKTEYETALKSIMESQFKNDNALTGYRRTIETALSTDDIIYGSKGYIRYKDKWVKPDEFELIRYSEGFVKYKGEFKNHKKLQKTVKQLTAPLMKKYLTRKYSGQTLHSKNIRYQKMILTRNNAQFSEYSVYYKWEVWTFKGMDEDICMIDIKYTVDKDKWSLIKGCE